MIVEQTPNDQAYQGRNATMKSICRLTALLVLFAVFLSACGGASAPQAAAPTAAPAAAPEATAGPAAAPEATAAPAAAEATAAPAAAEATAAPAPASGGDKTKITWWTENAEEPLQQALKRDFVDSFNAAHPNLELEITFKDKLDEVLRTAIQG